MEKGFINFYDHVRGYGFIRRESGRDVFFKHDDFLDFESSVDVCKGVFVNFEVIKADKGLRAVNIRIV